MGANTQYEQALVQGTQTFNSGSAAGLPSAFTKQFPNGHSEVYGLTVVGIGTVQSFLTQTVDPNGNVLNIQYDNMNRISSVTDAIGQISSFSYNDEDPYKITSITDPFGRMAKFTYDSNSHLQSITDQLSLMTSFTYNPPSALSADWVGTMTTPYGLTSFDYTGTTSDFGQREINMTDPMGLQEHARFLIFQQGPPNNYPGLPTGMTQPEFTDGPTLYWDKNAMANAPLESTSATEYDWYKTPNLQQSFFLGGLKKPLDSRIFYNYPGTTNQAGTSAIWVPTAVGRVFVDANGATQDQVSTHTYNSFGLVTQTVDPKGRVFNYIYASNGVDLLNTTDGNGEILSSNTYNSQHESLTSTGADGQTTDYTYNSAGQILSSTTPMGELTSYNYNGQGYLLSVTPPQEGAGVTYTYDNVGRVYTRSNAVQGTLTYHYDDGDRIKEVDYPDGTDERYGYTKLDLTSYTDRKFRTTSYAYDADRRKTSMTDPKLQMTQYGWCSCGSLTSITDPKSNQTSWQYDIEGRVIKKTYADQSFYTYQYDPGEGRLSLMTDALKQNTEYVYDVDDRLLNTNYFNMANPTSDVSFQYDLVLGRITQMTDGTGMTNYTYYPIGQVGGNKVETISQPVGTTTTNITYTYDNDGRMVGRAIDGNHETYGFNSTGQLTQVQNALGGFVYTYDPNSARLTQINYPNGQQTKMDYFTSGDPLGNSGSLKDLTNLGGGSTSGQTLAKFSYTYSPTGDIKTWQQQLDNKSSDAKTYGMGDDADSELEGVTLVSGSSGFDNLTANHSVTYGYDASGNRTVEQTPDFLHTFGTNNLNQLTNITPKPIQIVGFSNRAASVTVNGQGVQENSSFTYSTNIQPAPGNTTPLTVTEVGLDGTVNNVKNHVLNTQPFQYDANGNLVNDGDKTYQWDVENRLVGVVYLNPQPTSVADTIRMTYDGIGRRVSINELHGSTVLTTNTFIWCDSKLCQDRDSTGHTVVKQFFNQGEQINSVNYFYTKDKLGSVREMTDSNGTLQASYDYDSYGRQFKVMVNLDSDFGYTGFYINKTTHLNLTWYRAYDAEKGRWLNRDPLGEFVNFNLDKPTGPDLYAYSKNNPINLIDPLGLDCAGDCRIAYNKNLSNCTTIADLASIAAFALCVTLAKGKAAGIAGCYLVAQKMDEVILSRCDTAAYLTYQNCLDNCKKKTCN